MGILGIEPRSPQAWQFSAEAEVVPGGSFHGCEAIRNLSLPDDCVFGRLASVLPRLSHFHTSIHPRGCKLLPHPTSLGRGHVLPAIEPPSREDAGEKVRVSN